MSCHKVLGLTLCDTLKWKENTNEIITKASKRFHILRVLKNSGVPSMDLICVYNALVCSVLEYSCVVWATSLPRYLVDQIERIQKRAMRILIPGLKYEQALPQANVTSLEMRRDHHCRPGLPAAPPSPPPPPLPSYSAPLASFKEQQYF